MSLAGKESSQGDEYQLQVALHWCINLLQDDNIDYLILEAVTIPNSSSKIDIDDTYIKYKDNRKIFIQAKKNATDFNLWKLSDTTLKKEIKNAYSQYISNNSDPIHKIEFYSRTPFGDFNKIVEKIRFFSDYESFEIAPQNQIKLLQQISNIINETEKETFNFLLSISFGSTRTIDEWNENNVERLRYSLTNADLAKPYLEKILREHQINGNNRPSKITKNYILKELEKKGFILSLKYNECDILDDFKKASKIGRGKDYSIIGKYLEIKDTNTIQEFINEKNNASCVITNKAGSGKSYLLDETANYVEKNTKYALLFIKGDMFTKVNNDEDFVNQGIPKDLIGKVGLLSELRKVVIIIDSLDVIALNKEYGTLNYFISIIDRLKNINNVILLIACRTFDLKYESSFRDRKWDKRIELQEYNFELDIKPFLGTFNIDTSNFSENLKELLIIPQNLKLYITIYKKTHEYNINTEYELLEKYIEEIVINDNSLGEKALSMLLKLSNYCLENRTLNIPSSIINTEINIFKRLKSQGLLYVYENTIQFSHQTLVDIFIIRKNIINMSFCDFILSKPQFPFIRPIVRSYFFILYSYNNRKFRKEILSLIKNKKINYHIKRLIIESYSELEASSENWDFIKKIHNFDKFLFQRFFDVIKNKDWFDLFKNDFFTSLKSNKKKEFWISRLVNKSSLFINKNSNEIIDWYISLIKNKTLSSDTIYPISRSLSSLSNFKNKKIYNILIFIIEKNPKEPYLAELISKFVYDINQFDELLFDYMTKFVKEKNKSSYDMEWLGTHDDFFKKDFLEERLFKSEILLDKFVDFFENKSKEIYTSFLDEVSSYERVHSQSTMPKGIHSTPILNYLEKVLLKHASNNTKWWKKNELKLLNLTELFYKYILIQVFINNPENESANIFLSSFDNELLNVSTLKYEISNLINIIFPYIKINTQLFIQNKILKMYDTEPNRIIYNEYYKKNIYEYLIYIPTSFRTKESQLFINKYKKIYGITLPSPYIKSYGGLVQSPLSKECMSFLSTNSILKLFKHYNKSIEIDNSEFTERGLVGGKRSLCHLFETVVSENPKKYISLSRVLISKEYDKVFFNSLINGFSTYIDYDKGRLSIPNNISLDKSVPIKFLGISLLEIIEKYFNLLNSRTIVNCIRTCSLILIEEQYVERLVLLFHQTYMIKKITVFVNEDISKDIDSLNTIDGILGEAMGHLVVNLLENNKKINDILRVLVLRISKNGTNNIKLGLIRNIDFIIFKNKELGWSIFDNIFNNLNIKFLNYIYNGLYSNHHKDYKKVSFYLKQMFNKPDKYNKYLGQILCLCFLAKKIKKKDFYKKLSEINHDEVTVGVINVLSCSDNIINYQKFCIENLIYLLKNLDLNIKCLFQIEMIFNNQDNFHFISAKLVKNIIKSIDSKGIKEIAIMNIFGWLEYYGKIDFNDSLNISEKLVKKLLKYNMLKIYSSKKLISYFLLLMREADELDDILLTNRVLKLQNSFYKLNVNIDELYDEYK